MNAGFQPSTVAPEKGWLEYQFPSGSWRIFGCELLVSLIFGNCKTKSPWAVALKNVDGFAVRKSSYVAVCLHTLDVMRAGEVREKARDEVTGGTPLKTNGCPLKINGWFRCIPY